MSLKSDHGSISAAKTPHLMVLEVYSNEGFISRPFKSTALRTSSVAILWAQAIQIVL